MQTVLGIDAAWTATQPSGVALVAGEPGGWRLLAVEPSYAAFLARAEGRARSLPHAGSAPDPAALIRACRALAGCPPDLVTADIPLSEAPIAGRRPCDNAVSAAYGARKAGTHSPSSIRPGPLADTFRAGFAKCGYRLLTADVTCPGLAEVYPHAALLELTGAAKRLPYKAGKTPTYWPDLDATERGLALRRVWVSITASLDRRVAGTAAMLPVPDEHVRGRALKAFEDMLDAVVCAWVGCCMVEGSARVYGDPEAAIWVPSLAPGAADAGQE